MKQRVVMCLAVLALGASGCAGKASPTVTSSSHPAPSPTQKYACTLKKVVDYSHQQVSKLERAVAQGNSNVATVELFIFQHFVDTISKGIVKNELHGGELNGDLCLNALATEREHADTVVKGSLSAEEEKAIAELHQSVLMYYPGSSYALDAENWLREHDYPIPSPT